jgi:TatA/E family protein of Tat protein translocase
MFDLGTQELIVIFIVAFLVFGPKRLPELGRTLGKGINELKAAMRGVRETIEEAETSISEEIGEVKTDIEEKEAKTDISETVKGENKEGVKKDKDG